MMAEGKKAEKKEKQPKEQVVTGLVHISRPNRQTICPSRRVFRLLV